ncbi:hypothetical protein BpHYR1_031687 [Brachionus plicatilis]|uniref:Uncharacterized protein n=1 Tax=Brachionus plicatilis TaxID=10195 RepID=A0A3M7Q4M1_BRAPC|nr:hypothetical protein BpHYR1_031687 [Brachionus plicatilis]
MVGDKWHSINGGDKNADDTQSVAFDDDDNDYEDKMETTNQLNAEYDSDEDLDNEETEDEEQTEETNIDKTSKNGTIWIRLKDREETSLRKKINLRI